MGKTKFTPQQEEALEIKPGNVLVSAGAGSGKTAVLTERIFRIIKSGTSLDELLVLTFTNKAAFEMKKRVRKKLLDDESLNSLADQVEASNITTFDSYALSIVKKYGYRIGLSDDVDIADNVVFDVVSREILNEIFDEFYEKKDKDFLDLIYYYSIKNDSDIQEFVLETLHKFNYIIDKDEFYRTYDEKMFSDEMLISTIHRIYNEMKQKINYLRSEFYLNFSNENWVNFFDEYFYEPLSSNNYDDLYESLVIKFPGFHKISEKLFKIDDNYKQNFEDCREQFKSIVETVKLIGKTEDAIKNKDEMKRFECVLISIVNELDKRLLEFKRKYNVFEFADISTFAYRLIQIPDIKEKIKNKTKYIMIDEYQDTNDIQEAFVNVIAKDNVFMVGDVKQSIYRFRYSNPKLFVDKLNKYSRGDGGKLVVFPDNFRSRRDVIYSINEMFSDIMSEELGGVDYTNGHQLHFGNEAAYEHKGKTSQNCDIEFYGFDNDSSAKAIEVETNIVLDDIINKIDSHYQVYDFEKESLRDAKFSDFCILMQNRSSYDLIMKEFAKRSVPLVTDRASKTSELKIMLLVKSILRLINKISCGSSDEDLELDYASIARSFAFEISDEQIYSIIKNKKIKDTEIYLRASKLANEVKNFSLELFLIKIIDTFRLVDNLTKIGEIELNQSVLNHIVSFARDMDKIEYTFDQMVNFFDFIDKNEIDLDFEIAEDVSDAVSIMTMHISKGLEFPIVYYIGLEKMGKNNSSPIKGSLISRDYGIRLNNIFSEQKSPYLLWDKDDDSKEKDSEMVRLLYVALTRAKEKAIVVLPNDKLFPEKNTSKTLTMAGLLLLFKNRGKYSKTMSVVNSIYQPKENKEKLKKEIKIKSIRVQSEIYESKKASKVLPLSVNEELLEFGSRIHELLEIANFKTKDVSFIKNEKERKAVSFVVNNSLFSNIENAMVLHEYEFDDDYNNTHGVIDLLLVYNDHVDIVDFKLKHLNDEEYDYQLRVYEDFVKTIVNIPINKYLLSVLTGEVREVK